MVQMELKEKIKYYWECFLNGENERFFEFYRITFEPLTLAGRAINADIQVVMDAINILFADLWEHRTNYRHVQDILSYLIVCLKNKLIGNSTDIITNYALESLPLDAQVLSSPELTIIHREEEDAQQKELLTAINTLSKRKKELIVLKYFKGLSYEQIAIHTGLSNRTIYNKVNEAIKQLQTYCLVKSEEPNHPFHILKPSLQFFLNFFL